MSWRPSVPDSVWWTSPAAEFPPLEGALDVEVLILGGGITGVTLAYTLAERGCAVGLLDAGPLAASASARNAGFLLAAPAEPYREMSAFWGRDGARAVVTVGKRNQQRIQQLVETLSIDCDHRVTGSLRLARTEEEAEDQRASLADLNADGIRMLETPVSSVLPPETAGRFTAAFVSPDDAEIHPVRFLHGLALAAVGKGARIYAGTEVRAAQWSGGLWEAKTALGRAQSRTLVLATNAVTPLLCPALSPLIAPRRGQMLVTAPLERVASTRPTYAHWGYQYWRQLPDRRLIIGGWRETDLEGEVGYDDRPTPAVQSAIETGLAELVPEGTTIERRWAGTIGFARDGRPLVGWLDVEHHLAICAGYTGHGLGMAAACTQDLAALLEWRKAPEIATFDPARFPELRREPGGLTKLGTEVSAHG